MPHTLHSFSQDGSAPSTVLGGGMPEATKVPLLTQVQPSHDPTKAEKLSLIEADLSFVGDITLQAACTISGKVLGRVHQLADTHSQVVITETGSVEGDIVTHKASIMGRYNGTLDASGGSVFLHDKSVVTGHIRYAQLQVNGADLNATLERVLDKVDTKE